MSPGGRAGLSRASCARSVCWTKCDRQTGDNTHRLPSPQSASVGSCAPEKLTHKLWILLLDFTARPATLCTRVCACTPCDSSAAPGGSQLPGAISRGHRPHLTLGVHTAASGRVGGSSQGSAPGRPVGLTQLSLGGVSLRSLGVWFETETTVSPALPEAVAALCTGSRKPPDSVLQSVSSFGRQPSAQICEDSAEGGCAGRRWRGADTSQRASRPREHTELLGSRKAGWSRARNRKKTQSLAGPPADFCSTVPGVLGCDTR